MFLKYVINVNIKNFNLKSRVVMAAYTIEEKMLGKKLAGLAWAVS